MNEATVHNPGEAAFTIRKPMAGWQVELPATMDEIDYAVGSYSLQRGKRPGMAMRVTTWQTLGSLLSTRVPVNREEDTAPRLVISKDHDPDTITFFDDEL
jgi:hypothetical protein